MNMKKANNFHVIHVYVDGILRTLSVSKMMAIDDIKNNHIKVTMDDGEELEFDYDMKALETMVRET